MSDYLVSIATVTYNHEKYIAQALDSFLEQITDFRFKIVIGDDCSTDNTRYIIRQYVAKYPDNFDFIEHSKNVGPINNSLSVYEQCRTPYVAVCDGDDFWIDPYKLQKQVDFLKKNKQCCGVFTRTEVRFEHINHKNMFFPNAAMFSQDLLPLEELALFNPIHTASVMFRWRFASGDIREHMPDNICPGDYFLKLYHAQLGPFGFIDEVSAVYRRNNGGISASLEEDVYQTFSQLGLMELNFIKLIQTSFSPNISSLMDKQFRRKSLLVLLAFLYKKNTAALIEYASEHEDLLINALDAFSKVEISFKHGIIETDENDIANILNKKIISLYVLHRLNKYKKVGVAVIALITLVVLFFYFFQ